MTTNVFGIIVAGRLLQTNFTQVSETEFLIEVPNAELINHIVVFLTGIQPFLDELGGSVYMRWQQTAAEELNWHFLGFISNNKPSAIFRVSQLSKIEATNATIFDANSTVHYGTVGSAQIGIIVEPLTTIAFRVPAEGTGAVQQNNYVTFAEKMLENFLNHVYSFTVSLPHPQDALGINIDFIPLKAVQEWFNTFQRRLKINPNYWKSLT